MDKSENLARNHAHISPKTNRALGFPWVTQKVTYWLPFLPEGWHVRHQTQLRAMKAWSMWLLSLPLRASVYPLNISIRLSPPQRPPIPRFQENYLKVLTHGTIIGLELLSHWTLTLFYPTHRICLWLPACSHP